MSERAHVDVAFDGTYEVAHFDVEGNLAALEWLCDVEPIIEANKRAQADGDRGFGRTRELQHVAAIPPVLLLKWANEKGVTPSLMDSREGFEEIVLKMIRDPDYRWLRRDI